MIPKVIIGVGYGDEGKGATTNYLATKDSVVIRFNGGAQAGHTVVHNGLRHVFSHIGSGALKGAQTHLSRFFVANAMSYRKEYNRLLSLGIQPKVSISPYSYITTIYDIYINHEFEKINKHGSVGCGFGETIERNERGPKLTISDCTNRKKLKRKLGEIKDVWIPKRCAEIGVPMPSTDIDIDFMVADFEHFLNLVNVIDDNQIMSAKNPLVFEGAQGLMLDPDHGTMPHCTRSSCGLKNIDNFPHGVDVYYVSRPYTTRHGSGPLPFEFAKPKYVVDLTNTTNEYQGNMRYAPLNLDNIKRVVSTDIKRNRSKINDVYSVLTCIDQLEIKTNVILYDQVLKLFSEQLFDIYKAVVDGRLIKLYKGVNPNG